MQLRKSYLGSPNHLSSGTTETYINVYACTHTHTCMYVYTCIRIVPLWFCFKQVFTSQNYSKKYNFWAYHGSHYDCTEGAVK